MLVWWPRSPLASSSDSGLVQVAAGLVLLAQVAPVRGHAGSTGGANPHADHYMNMA